MTFYQIEMARIAKLCYSNTRQLETVIRTRRYLHNYYDQPLNLRLLSKAGLASKFHLLRLFKKYYGQTPAQYLTCIRIEKAKALMQTGFTISQTCFAVGFESPSSFSSRFKERVGCAPREFQKKQFSQSFSQLNLPILRPESNQQTCK